MSTDASGLVFYGFPLVDEDGEAAEPWKPTGGGLVFSRWEQRYLKAKGAFDGITPGQYEAMTGSCPVDVHLAGYSGNLISCVVIRESFVEAEWAEVKPLKTLETKPEWDSQLREWCELLDVPYLQPGWFVASLYF